MPDFEPDVGVLIVHGIGTQAEGAELRHWVDAVVGYLDAYDADPGARAGILQATAGDKLVRVVTPPLGGTTPGHRQRWLVGEAWWAEAFDVPNRKEVSSWLAGVASWFVYLFVVRLWRRFNVDRWHVAAGLAFALSLGWLVHEATGGSPGGWAWAALALSAAAAATTARRSGRRLGAVVVAGSVVVIYPLAALGTVALLALWLLGLLPGKAAEKARAIQVSLAGSVGDVYALVSSRRREQAMFDAIAAGARRLTSGDGMEAKPVVLMAHSQGAALAYRAINGDVELARALAGRDVTLVTYGAGIVPIHVLEHRLRTAPSGWHWAQSFAGLVALVLLAFGVARVAADGVDRVTRAAAGASFALTACVFAATWRQEHRSRCHSDAVQIAAPGDHGPQAKDEVCIRLRSPGAARLRWVDFWAPWDPVPNGPLCVSTPCVPAACGPASLPPPGDGDEFLSCRVANLHQPWRDHVVYRDNPEDVVSRWVGEIAARAGPVAPGDVERPRRPGAPADVGRDWRRRRGRDLLLGQVLALVAGLVVVFSRWDELDDLGRRVARRLPLRAGVGNVLDAVPAGLRDAFLGEGRDSSHLHGLLVALAALVAVIAVASAVVAWWQAASTGRFLGGADDVRLPVKTALAASLVAAAAVAGALLWAAFGLHIAEVPTTPVRVHPADIGSPPAASPRTEVRFEPVGTGDDTPVVVNVGDDVHEVVLDAEVRYLITATASGGKDCAVSVDRRGSGSEVHVRCVPSGTPLRQEVS